MENQKIEKFFSLLANLKNLYRRGGIKREGEREDTDRRKREKRKKIEREEKENRNIERKRERELNSFKCFNFKMVLFLLL